MNDDLHDMTPNNENPAFALDAVAVRSMRLWAKYLNYAITVVSILVLIGWQFDIDIIKRPIPHLIAMNPLTALLFLLTGLAFLLLAKQDAKPTAISVGYTFAILTFITAFIVFASNITGLNIRPDTILFHNRITHDLTVNVANRMAGNTAMSFVLVAISLLLLRAETRRGQLFSTLISSALFFLSLLFVIGYLYQVTAFRAVLLTYFPMAIHTAICFVMFSLAVLFHNPSHGIMKQFTSAYSGSSVGRLLIIASVIVPILLGFISILCITSGWLPLQLGTASLILALVIIFITLSWFVTTSLNKKDFSKQATQKALEETRQQLQTVFNAAPDAVIVMDDAGQVLTWNRKSELLFGWTEQEVKGRPLNETIIPERYGKLHTEGLRQFLKTGNAPLLDRIFETYARKKNGEEFEVGLNISATRDVHGQYIFIGFIRDISESKRREQRFRKTERDFQLLVRSVKEYAIIMLDTEGKIVSWNAGAKAIKGYDAEEVTGKHMNLFYTDEDIKKGMPSANLQKTLQLGHYETEGWRKRKDGSVFYASVVFSALYDDENNLYGYAKVTKDITEKRKNEERIHFLATIANNIQDPVISSDNDFKITGWNEAAERLLEWKTEETIGLKTTEVLNIIYPFESREEVQKSFAEKGFWQGEVIYHTKSGKKINVLSTASQLKDAMGNISGSLVLARDITERKKAEAALTKLNAELEQRVKDRTRELTDREKRFRALIENNEDIIALVNEKFEVVYRSPASARITGWTDDEQASMSDGRNIHPADTEYVTHIMRQVLTNPAKPYDIIFRGKHKNGRYLWLEGVITNMIHDPSIQAIIINLRDVTERKEAIEKIQRLNFELEERVAKRTAQLKKTNEELEAFSYSISHDLRAPLRGIIGFTNILEEEYAHKFDEEGKRITGVIKKNTTRMGQLIDDLLTFSRMSRQDIVKTSIDNNKIVNEIIEEYFSNENNKKINWNIHPLPATKGDNNAIRQVWINLLSNAVKYSKNEAYPSIEVGSSKENKSTSFYVKDNGVGFDEKYKNKLFKVFQRLHNGEQFEGTGIGLAIVEKIISKHNGKVWTQSEVNKGAAFYFSLPDDNNENKHKQ